MKTLKSVYVRFIKFKLKNKHLFFLIRLGKIYIRLQNSEIVTTIDKLCNTQL